ncbi:molecular chaperone DnaJ [Haploplasma axanthum]|uniref:Chaperone protein DnaJ n=1 Tax=Haploplasma axanthum TaxID=29552 RepID=A0A449BEP1_HAPAX|nr:molecular chaperone DnaJ [Haploplasma axanthum]VEU80898.1 Heat shock protein DnaJ [Haploplasma axanthum]
MANKRDYYEVLGVEKTAAKDEIDKAYRKKAKQYHPDVSKEENAEEKFKEVQEAYETLSDQNKRAAYDQYGHAGNPFGQGGSSGFGGGFEGFSGFGGFGDIFSDLFGGGRQQRQEAYNGPQRGSDIEKYMTIDFMEAALGTKKTVKVEVEEDCPDCKGTGAKSKDDIKTCSHCQGKGYVNVDQRTILGTMRSQQTCSVCGGTGKEIKNKCTTCGGIGRVKVSKTVEVNIPAGIDNNMTLRVAGYGNGGIKGGPHGDLLITFRVRPHKVFERREDDIYLNVPISFTEAALGTTKDVPTIYGEVSLKIPAGIEPGTQLRMREKGVASVRSKRKGDQFVIVEVKAPKKLSPKEKKLYEELAELEQKENDSMWTKFKNLFK